MLNRTMMLSTTNFAKLEKQNKKSIDLKIRCSTLKTQEQLNINSAQYAYYNKIIHRYGDNVWYLEEAQ